MSTGEGGPHVTTTWTCSNMFIWEPNDLASDTSFFTVKGLLPSPGLVLAPQKCSNLFNLDFTVSSPSPVDMFNLVHWWYLFLMQLHMKSIIYLNILTLQKPVDHSNNSKMEDKIDKIILLIISICNS